MKKIFVDYFGVWASGRIGRTRFFALSIVSAVAGMVFSLALTVAAVSIGLLSNENIPTPVTDEVAQSFHLTALDYQTEAATGQFVTSNSVNAPWWLAAPVFHLFFANISMKRFRDMGLPGGWTYLGTHSIVAPLHFLVGAPGLAVLLLSLFSAVLLFTPSNGFK
jgi:uncharacterized membrane protein YhaH (DUF805 family)